MTNRLVLVRHGESETKLLSELWNRSLKHGLTEKGKQQTYALAQSLQSVPVVAITGTAPLPMNGGILLQGTVANETLTTLRSCVTHRV